ncbi:MAG TPA: cation transporter [Ignavibacteriaceae bacterium]|nr:cation transporter [Ignavibacteriaceae bacterium]HRN26228.1 cation transporter [Ignavibacteriaceae bacterium]HRP93945.1 cation transporter [Ignavibacteriaceae bacterium]HRQ55126.1 cation transporter [Ignavibacteriaceae bacterium]
MKNLKLEARNRVSEFNSLVNIALALSLITIFYNLAEGVVSVAFGLDDETLALFGFGLDSFVEVISGIGILHLIIRMKRNPVAERDTFERTALKITGFSFYLLAAGLVIASILLIINNVKPETTIVGIIISLISIITMYALVHYKLKVGRALNSDAIIADANCTKTCFYLSFILLASSLSYEIFKIGYLDIAGSLGVAYFAFKEGKESIEKSNSEKLSCSCEDGCD